MVAREAATAPRPAREHLARGGLLLGVTFASGALLALVFPSANDFKRSTAALPIGAYAAAYLDTLVKANPRDFGARLAFVRQLAGRGEFARALAELDVVPRDSEFRADVDRLGLQISWAAARALPDGDAGKIAALADVARRLENLAESGGGPAAQLTAAADIALQIERPGLASRIFERAAQQERGDARADTFAQAARWRLAAGDRAGALKLLDAAAKSAYTHRAQSDLAVKAVRTAEASGDPALALEHASAWVTIRPHDGRLLAEAARLALAANRPRVARDFGRRLLRENPGDTDERDRQALRELAAGDPAAAWPWVEEAVRRHPNSREWREREAHTAEWTGRPEIALRDWLWLAGGRRGRGDAAETRASR